jgi:hypothetical protein
MAFLGQKGLIFDENRPFSHYCIMLAFMYEMGVDLPRFERWNVQSY